MVVREGEEGPEEDLEEGEDPEEGLEEEAHLGAVHSGEEVVEEEEVFVVEEASRLIERLRKKKARVRG